MRKGIENCRLLLFDLDGTLLDSSKRIPPRTREVLMRCRQKGLLIGVCTSRGEQNTLSYIEEIQPDVTITSGGAMIGYEGGYLYKAEFSREETREMIAAARRICGPSCEITVDTAGAHYWNYKTDPKRQDPKWGDSIYTDFEDFDGCALKMCVEIFDEQQAAELQQALGHCDSIRFSDGYWYKFTKKDVTKENAIHRVCAACQIEPQEIAAFGDDLADIGMMQLCGLGIAMGNAVDKVRAIADLVIGSNDEEGIAEYLGKII